MYVTLSGLGTANATFDAVHTDGSITAVTTDENGRILSVKAACKAVEMEFYADHFIDATGDAELSYLAGCACEQGRDGDGLCQPMTLCFRLGNVDVERFFASKEGFQKKYKELRETGEIKNPREDILIFKTPVPNVLHFNTTRVVKKNPTCPEDVTEAELRDIVTFACTAASLSTQKHGGISSVPSEKEVLANDNVLCLPLPPILLHPEFL